MKKLAMPESLYLKSVSFILLLTGMAKLISASQQVPILDMPDPLMEFLSIKQVFIIAGAIEVAVAFYILKFKNNITRQLQMIAWLSFLFIVYHVGLYLIAFDGFCPCLGNANSWFKLSDNTVNSITNALLAYLSVGSISILAIKRHFQNRNVATL